MRDSWVRTCPNCARVNCDDKDWGSIFVYATLQFFRKEDVEETGET